MDFIYTFFSSLVEDGLLNDISISIFTSIVTLPLTSGFVKNIFKNRKKVKIGQARKEMHSFYITRLLDGEVWNDTEIEEWTCIFASKYGLKSCDLFQDKTEFTKQITNTIAKLEIINNNMKGTLIGKIRNNHSCDKCIEEKDNILKNEEMHLPPKENYENFEFDDLDYEIDVNFERKEMRDICMTSLISCLLVFIISLISVNTMHVLYEWSGHISLVFFNTIIAIIAMLPILANGLFHLKEFNIQSKKLFYLLVVVLLLCVVNCIYIVNILIK